MKWRLWIGGVLLLAVLWGTMGCGETREQGGDHMVDGPDMVYTPEDQSPFAGSWQNAGESIVLEIEGIGQLEASRMNLTVDGVVKLTSDMWVYKTGYVKLTEGYNDVLLPEPFQLLEFFHSLDAFCLYTTEGETFMLARPGVESPGVESQRILSFRH